MLNCYLQKNLNEQSLRLWQDVQFKSVNPKFNLTVPRRRKKGVRPNQIKGEAVVGLLRTVTGIASLAKGMDYVQGCTKSVEWRPRRRRRTG